MAFSLIRSPVINPLLVLLTLRAARAVHAKVPPADDAWAFIPGLRLSNPDPDRHAADWQRAWSETTRRSLAAAWKNPLLARVLNEMPSREVSAENDVLEKTQAPREAGDVAAALCLPTCPSWLQWDCPVDTSPSPDTHVMGWRLPPVAAAWPSLLLNRWSEPSAAQVQRWVIVPGSADGRAWWTEHHVDDTLRWGVSWWFQPPSPGEGWESYFVDLQAVGARIIVHPALDQWVWPWADLLQQAMEEAMRSASVSARSGSPFSWQRRKGEEWGRLRKAIWEGAAQAMGKPGLLEDLMAGIVFDAVSRGWRA